MAGILPRHSLLMPSVLSGPQCFASFLATTRNRLFLPPVAPTSWSRREVNEPTKPQHSTLSTQPSCTLQLAQCTWCASAQGRLRVAQPSCEQQTTLRFRSGFVSSISLGNWSCFRRSLPVVRSLAVAFRWWALTLSPALAIQR